MAQIDEDKRSFDEIMAGAREHLLAHIPGFAAKMGWSEQAFQAAIEAASNAPEKARRDLPKFDPQHARLAFARGAIDACIAFHRAGDEEMVARLSKRAASIPRFRDKIVEAIILRFEIAGREKEAVRRAAALMALPQNMNEAAGLIWETCDKIWIALGDQAIGASHYTKRASLSSVYSACFLYWLGQDGARAEELRGYVERRVDDAMRFGGLIGSITRIFAPENPGQSRGSD